MSFYPPPPLYTQYTGEMFWSMCGFCARHTVRTYPYSIPYVASVTCSDFMRRFKLVFGQCGILPSTLFEKQSKFLRYNMKCRVKHNTT